MGPSSDVSDDHLPLIKDVRTLSRARIPHVFQELRSLERKTFSSNEVFPFDDSLLTKRNMEVLVGFSCHAAQNCIVAYAVCMKWHHRLLLHKICVSPAHRCHGIGSLLLHEIVARARRSSCRGIDLWVDEANNIARSLYTKHGFVVQETLPDYYSPGRNGVKMVHSLQP